MKKNRMLASGTLQQLAESLRALARPLCLALGLVAAAGVQVESIRSMFPNGIAGRGRQ